MGKKNNYNWVATFPCDTPFFTNKIINQLIKKTKIKKRKFIMLKVESKDIIYFLYGQLSVKKFLRKK